jgi:hypothetical protein
VQMLQRFRNFHASQESPLSRAKWPWCSTLELCTGLFFKEFETPPPSPTTTGRRIDFPRRRQVSGKPSGASRAQTT